MKALVATDYAPLDRLTVGEAPAPEPGPGQVLVRVEAAALNPFDLRVATGELSHVFPVEHPVVLGMEATGIVEGRGEGVTDVAVGDAVVAFTFGVAGSIAELTVGTVGPSLAARPPGLRPAEAAGIPVAAMTAAQLVDAAVTGLGANPGASILVVGATGGVGLFAVQLAARAGARVLATARPADADAVRALGASEVIDHGTAPVAAEARRLQPGGVDAVIELVHGGPDLATTAAAARPGGRLVSPHPGGPETFDGGVSGTYLHVNPTPGLLQSLVERVTSGDLVSTVGRTYPFPEAARAAVDLRVQHTWGKVVVTF
jgi:NADPH:quinone reductase